MKVLNYVINNWQHISVVAVQIATAVVTVSSIVVKFTPNVTNNKFLCKFVKLCETVAMNNHPIKLEENKNDSTYGCK